MLFEENLKKLNEKLSQHKLRLENQGEKLVLREDVPYTLYNLPRLEEELKNNYNLRFNGSEKYWYIGNEGIRKLSERVLKTKPSRSETVLKDKLADFIGQMEEKGELRVCVERFLSDNPFFYESPGAIYYHHAYKHGLLEHSIQTVELSFSMIDAFDEGITINKDLIIAGSIIHDIGKINCYKFVEGGIDACPALSEQDHIINGVKMVSQYIQGDQLDELLHIIASHHQEKEYGSPISPISNEAWIISVADKLSSRIMG